MRRLLGGLVVFGLLVTACGDDDESGGTDPVEDDGGTSAGLTGEPIVVGAIVERVLDEPRDELHAAALAAVEQVNDAGGIDGRPLEVRFCDPAGDPNAAAQCARDMVDDEEVMAIVGFLSTASDGAQAVLIDAGMASIGNTAITPVDFNCDVCFPVGGGSIGAIAGQATLVADLLGDSVNMIIADIPSGHGLPPVISGVLASRGSTATLDRVVPTADPGTDVSAPVATAAGGDPDGIAVVLSHATSLRIFQEAKNQGVDVPLVYTAANVTEDELSSIGDSIDGVYLASQYRLAGPAVDEFRAAMDEQAPDAPKNETATTMWISMKLFAHVVQGLEEVSRASVLEAMGQVSGYETGFTPPLDFTSTFEGLGGSLPRLFNTSLIYGRVEDGGFVELNDGEFVDVFASVGD